MGPGRNLALRTIAGVTLLIVAFCISDDEPGADASFESQVAFVEDTRAAVEEAEDPIDLRADDGNDPTRTLLLAIDVYNDESEEVFDRIDAAHVVGELAVELHDADAVANAEVVSEAIDAVSYELKNDDEEIRLWSACVAEKWLGAGLVEDPIDAERLRDGLSEVLTSNDDPGRCAAAAALGHFGNYPPQAAEACEALKDELALEPDGDPRVRRAILKALERIANACPNDATVQELAAEGQTIAVAHAE